MKRKSEETIVVNKKVAIQSEAPKLAVNSFVIRPSQQPLKKTIQFEEFDFTVNNNLFEKLVCDGILKTMLNNEQFFLILVRITLMTL